MIYQYVKANGMITTQQVVDIVDAISTTQGALVAISRLMKKNLLKKIGKESIYSTHLNNRPTQILYII